MSSSTTNYNLKKPAGTDYVDIDDINGNMDVIDATMKQNADGIAALRESVSPKGAFSIVVMFSTVKMGANYHAFWQLPLDSSYESAVMTQIDKVGGGTSEISTSTVTVRFLGGHTIDFYTSVDGAAGKCYIIQTTLS